MQRAVLGEQRRKIRTLRIRPLVARLNQLRLDAKREVHRRAGVGENNAMLCHATLIQCNAALCNAMECSTAVLGTAAAGTIQEQKSIQNYWKSLRKIRKKHPKSMP